MAKDKDEKEDDLVSERSTLTNNVNPGFRRMKTNVLSKTEDEILNNMKSTGLKRQPTKRTKPVLSTNKLKLTKDKKDKDKKKINQYILE